jgi:hypothetical protein
LARDSSRSIEDKRRRNTNSYTIIELLSGNLLMNSMVIEVK